MNDPVNQPQSLAKAWLVTLTASLFFFYAFIQLNLFNAIDTSLMKTFNLNAIQLGKLGSMYSYANAIFLFPAGILLDRYSPKKLLLGAVILCTLGTLMFGLSQSYEMAKVWRFLVGTSAAFCFLSSIRIASRWFPASKMAFVTGIIVTMAMLGGLVAQTPLALLNEIIGWRDAVMLDAGLGLIIAVVIFLFVEDRPKFTNDQPQKNQSSEVNPLGFWQGIKLVLLNPNNWLGGVYTSLMNLPVFLLGALWGIDYLVQVHHVTPVEASYATTLLFMGVIFGSPTFGWFSDRVKRRVWPMILGAILSLVLMLVLIYATNLSLMMLCLLFLLIGFVTSSQVLSYPVIAELNPPALTSTAVSIDSMTIMVSGALFQPFFGWVMQLTWNHQHANGLPLYSVTDFTNAMLIMPIGFFVSIFVAWMIKETYCRAQQ